jgi:glucokinase
MIIRSANLPGFEQFTIRSAVTGALDLPGILDNDANAACWGEFCFGAGRGIMDMVMFTLGTGIGGGIVCHGRLVHGAADNAAELGHMIIIPQGRSCNCGQQGCLEAYASANQTARRAEEALAQSKKRSALRSLLKKNGSLTCKDVFDQAQAHDKLARSIVDGTAQALAQACICMNHITEPTRIILAGGMAQAGQFLIDQVRHFYKKMIWLADDGAMEICLTQLGPYAGLIGAAALAQHAFNQAALSPPGT